MNGEPVKISHPKAAKTVGVPADLLGLLCAERAVPIHGKPGPYYLLDPAELPDRPTLVALARDRYRTALAHAATAAEKLGSEAQAVLYDTDGRLGTC